MHRKLYEFGALLDCTVVVAAESEEKAREAISSWDREWYRTGYFLEVIDVQLFNEQDPTSQDLDDLKDEAQVVV
jgi:hypothetical protein